MCYHIKSHMVLQAAYVLPAGMPSCLRVSSRLKYVSISLKS